MQITNDTFIYPTVQSESLFIVKEKNIYRGFMYRKQNPTLVFYVALLKACFSVSASLMSH